MCFFLFTYNNSQAAYFHTINSNIFWLRDWKSTSKFWMFPRVFHLILVFLGVWLSPCSTTDMGRPQLLHGQNSEKVQILRGPLNPKIISNLDTKIILAPRKQRIIPPHWLLVNCVLFPFPLTLPLLTRKFKNYQFCANLLAWKKNDFLDRVIGVLTSKSWGVDNFQIYYKLSTERLISFLSLIGFCFLILHPINIWSK